jgi:hypothetical protein
VRPQVESASSHEHADTAHLAEEVRNEFEKLKQALNANDASAAADAVTQSTLDYYDSCRVLALDSKQIDFADVELLAVVLTYQLRYLCSRDELAQMQGSELFEWAVSSGLVDKSAISKLEIHSVQCDGATAFATLAVDGQVDPNCVFTFRWQSGRWKLDMPAAMRQVSRALEEVRSQAGKTKVEFAVFMLEQTYEEEISPAILMGPLR